MIYRYGDSWEKYPVQIGDLWVDKKIGSVVSVCDITRTLPEYMLAADMIYCDPPWSLGNVNCFYTKADHPDRIHYFSEFYSSFFSRVRQIHPKVCYVEIGKQNRDEFLFQMQAIFPDIREWKITYYKKNPCFLIRGGHERWQKCDFTGMDDINTPFAAIHEESVQVVADLCTGQGLTAVAAFRLGKSFVGTELNRRRLAVAIDRVNKLGGNYARSVS